MSKAIIENEIRDRIFSIIIEALEAKGEQPMRIASGEFTIPVVDSQGEEKFANIKISIPRGKRVDGTYEPYDGYAAAEEYRIDEEEKAAIAKAKAEKKEMEEKAKAQRRAARKTVKTMKKDVEEIFISKPDDLV